ncbi:MULTISPECIES: acetyl/propionyl/methylcrotonyl-CoA carboxylase subunit alpha [Burkholderiales]|jgi:geranyl-CoA carboxylase alpha subunit|uniref:Acetyl-/propionyl-coenzyme A carboxylase alpha chain n=2 Tax=Burkholderiales TaxID=80840 RepID=A0AAD2QEJ4_ACHAE|nr:MULTISPECIES: biotin carboxylase N-terminal domain-containing protein [Achromobacter]MCA0324624.1 ATP-grasp domain-containing protein [Pseudomonadota bacterium]TXH14283.1 MAG: ATP-grasp domain-containing protein [Gammaproteobacteria bacterium]CAB3922192.1 Acetyl-/propionyl-coenzyme A carboxylase alpha chain [Achromobacter mucicolens]CUJ79154.1 Acetyl-/propionyl-coenzyme A carboxylase alpha chain [Achromobacter aegrifaciens]
MKRFSSILIANRGEIAVRIARTAQRLGYRVIAVYSDADVSAPHVQLADDAVRIGASAPRDSYLNAASIIAAAQHSGAGAVHPGYGFLAENAEFAQAVVDAGLIWIGPPPSAIRAMGDKAQAKRLMKVAEVPCVPGYDGDAQDEATLRAEGQRIGFPLMIKATAGGGGRGMRLVESAAAFDAHLSSARSEAQAAFGDSTVLLERAIVQPRHVEIQIFADSHGNVVHLGERDCSVQRRHQKVIEEAPSPALAGSDGAQLRRRMGAMAVAAARAITYCGAGTIECLLDASGEYYFMEMNTRLQVEHPVTEALTGYDLVEWQLRVAQGEVLPECSQDEILRRFESGGHAVEVRLCAEDPWHGFLPQSGRLLAWQPGTAVRVDHALEARAEVPPYYDSMVAKFVSHGTDRDAASSALAEALRTAVVLGMQTNQAFLAACLQHPTFVSGEATTGFIAAHGDELLRGTPPMRASLAAMVLYASEALRMGNDPMHIALALPWARPMRFALDGEAIEAKIETFKPNRYRVACGAATEDFTVTRCREDGLTVTSSAGRESIAWAFDEDRLFVSQHGRQTILDDQTLTGTVGGAASNTGAVRAPMAGRLVAMYVSNGQTVEKGTPLLVLEAMKMEHPAIAPMDAVVTRVCFEEGAQVTAGALLIELTAAP